MKNEEEKPDICFREPHDGVPRPQPIDFVFNFFSRKKNGFFVDVGAHDGVTWSNSLALERQLHWKGICIEPNPELFNLCDGIRTSINLNECCSDEEKNEMFRIIEGEAACIGGIVGFFEEDHKQRIEEEVERYSVTYKDVAMPTRTLKSLIEELEITKIDYLSIDCEGAEAKILKGLDLSKHRPTLISVENQENKNRKSDIEAKTLLLDFDYEEESRVCGDLFFSTTR